MPCLDASLPDMLRVRNYYSYSFQNEIDKCFTFHDWKKSFLLL